MPNKLQEYSHLAERAAMELTGSHQSLKRNTWPFGHPKESGSVTILTVSVKYINMANILAKLVNMLDYVLETPVDVAKSVSMNFRKLRKNKKVTLKELSERSVVSLSSIKRFEYTGEISFVC